jgi:hypothetical protein
VPVQPPSPETVASECERSLAQLRSALDNTLRLFGEVREVRQSLGVSQMGALLAANARGGPNEAEQRFASIEDVISKQLGAMHHRIVASGAAPFAGAGASRDPSLSSSTWVPLAAQQPPMEQSLTPKLPRRARPAEGGAASGAGGAVDMSVDQSVGMSLNMDQLNSSMFSLGQSGVSVNVEPFLERYSDLLLNRIVEKMKATSAVPPPLPPSAER